MGVLAADVHPAAVVATLAPAVRLTGAGMGLTAIVTAIPAGIGLAAAVAVHAEIPVAVHRHKALSCGPGLPDGFRLMAAAVTFILHAKSTSLHC
jgi:adenine/guanine phosphoribosyltransferase-like PRPP-binding protein